MFNNNFKPQRVQSGLLSDICFVQMTIGVFLQIYTDVNCLDVEQNRYKVGLIIYLRYCHFVITM